MIEGLPEELQEYLERVAEEIRRGGSPPQHIPRVPKHWKKLLAQVDLAADLHRSDPNHALVKLGRYELLGVHGRGASGLVFEAIDPILGRRVALKLCDGRDEKTAQAVLTEAWLLAKLNHDNVITVHDIDLHDEDLFIVMEFATGKTAHHFASSGRPWQDILDVYLGAGAGLAAAHAKDIVHGDFKPDNVLVDADGSRPRVADFGFARLRLKHTPEPEPEREQVRGWGTYGFMAPEVLRGRAGDALSDQWSFCASVWQSLDGELPFEIASKARMLEMIERTKPRRFDAAVPETLRAVLERGLAADPADRFPSMEALVQALARVRHSTVTPPQEPFELSTRPPQRRGRKGPAWAHAAVAGMLVGGLSVFAAMREPARDDATEPTTSTSECAVAPGESLSEDPELRQATLDVCREIRAGHFQQADSDWDEQWSPGDAAVAEATLIVARTFVEAAESIGARDPEQARVAALAAEWWADQLGQKYVGVSVIHNRAAPFRGGQSQHSARPDASTQP